MLDSHEKSNSPEVVPDLAARVARDYQTVALILQGGGALGAYQAGVYQGLHEAAILPTWFAGISIGAINCALLAGNAPEHRLQRLESFWTRVCAPALGPMLFDLQKWAHFVPDNEEFRAFANTVSAVQAIVEGQAGFFVPHKLPPWLNRPGSPAATSYYDTTPLKSTLETLVDFDRINARETRLSVGAVNVRTGNFAYFDNQHIRIRPEHIMASGALPPAFPAIEIDGEFYWDGGLVSNTPLEYVLDCRPAQDTLAFQVDLWTAKGPAPKNIADVSQRYKDIQFSSRTRRGTNAVSELQLIRSALSAHIQQLPAETQEQPAVKKLREMTLFAVFNIVHLIYQSKAYEKESKDYEFGITSMIEHWTSGLDTIRASLAHTEYFDRPNPLIGVATHDVHR